MARNTASIRFWFYSDVDKAMDDREKVVERGDFSFRGHAACYELLHRSVSDAPHKGDLLYVQQGDLEDFPDFHGVFFVDDRITVLRDLQQMTALVHIIASPSMGSRLETGLEGMLFTS